MYLAQDPIARLLVASLRRACCWVIMNWALMHHGQPCSRVALAKGLTIAPAAIREGATARQANLILGRTGETFWQAESYDHWVRDASEWRRIASYIENNPVKAGWRHAQKITMVERSRTDRSAETPGTGPQSGSLGAAATSGCATGSSPQRPAAKDSGLPQRL